MTITESVFSDYEVRQIGVKVEGEESYTAVNCVGSVEEELEALVVTKNCRGVVQKTRVRGTGAGTLTISAHMPYAIYTKMYGMVSDGLADGVQAYGRNSVHPVFSLVMDTYDEDGVQKLRAYPCCIFQAGPARSTENGAEEVAEIEMEISVMPDDDGNCLYECAVNDLGTDTNQIKTKWMTQFTPELVQAAA